MKKKSRRKKCVNEPFGRFEEFVLEMLLLRPEMKIEEVEDVDVDTATATEIEKTKDGAWDVAKGDSPTSSAHQEGLPWFRKKCILSLEHGKGFAMSRLQDLDFTLSQSQLDTPRDGNCLFHALLDQIRCIVVCIGPECNSKFHLLQP